MPLPARTCDLGRVEYVETAQLQRSLRAAREEGAIADTLLMLEHDPVITTGHRTEPHEVAYALTTDVPVVPTERGGKATYHGPGQAVAYPIVDLRQHGSDIKAYVCKLEQAIIDTLGTFGIVAMRNPGYPGVWTAPDRKIASIGVRVTRWVSFHGIALNVDCDMAPFTWFTPCGIEGIEMTSMQQLLGDAAPSCTEVSAELQRQLAAHLGLDTAPVAVAELHAVAERFPVEEPDLVPVQASEPRELDLAAIARSGSANG